MGRRNSRSESHHHFYLEDAKWWNPSPHQSSLKEHIQCKPHPNTDIWRDEWRPTQADQQQPCNLQDVPLKSVIEKDHDKAVVAPEREGRSLSSSMDSDGSSVVYMKWISTKPRSHSHIFSGRGLDDASPSIRTVPSVSPTESEDSIEDDTQGLLKNTTSPRKRQSFNNKLNVPVVVGKKLDSNEKNSHTAFSALHNDSGDANDRSSNKSKLFCSHQRSDKLSSPKTSKRSEQAPPKATQGSTCENSPKERLSLGRRLSLKRLLKRSMREPAVPMPDESSESSPKLPKESQEPLVLEHIEKATPPDNNDDDEERPHKMESRTEYDFDELVPYSKGGCAKSKLIRFGVSENTLRLRKKIDLLLRRLGVDIKKDLCLNPKGICYFGHDKFVIVVEVPNNSDCVFIYSMLHRLTTEDRAASLMYKALTLNYMQQETRGACISMDDNEFTLSFSAAVDAMDLREFQNIIGNFVELVVDLEKKLMEANELEFVQIEELDETAEKTNEENNVDSKLENPVEPQAGVSQNLDLGAKHMGSEE